MDNEKLRFWETRHIHSFPWHQVAAGYWFRYPNQHSSHVFSVDTLETKIVDGKLYSRRLIVKTNPLPSWGRHFFSVRRVPVIEESVVDPSGHSLTWYTRNIGLGKFMSTVEKATLTKSEEAEDETVVLKQVWIGSSILGFRSAIKKFGIDRYKKNCVLATEGFETVLSNHFNTDGVEPAPHTDTGSTTTATGAATSSKSECPFANVRSTSSGRGTGNGNGDAGNKSADISLVRLNIGNKTSAIL